MLSNKMHYLYGCLETGSSPQARIIGKLYARSCRRNDEEIFFGLHICHWSYDREGAQSAAAVRNDSLRIVRVGRPARNYTVGNVRDNERERAVLAVRRSER